ncbi:MAG: hypothetical protein ACI87E_003651 [Mariniblastus sp.]|jgi:hypothetical protein
MATAGNGNAPNMTIDNTLSRVDHELMQGRLWRAKEILGSSLSTYGYARKILRNYADVLMRMGDELEAGKYYLLSVDSPNESEQAAIELFFSRFAKVSYQQLLSKFPHGSRLKSRDDYPAPLRKHLVEIGAPPQLATNVQPTATENNRQDLIFRIGCCLIGCSLITCLLVGVSEIFSWLW